MWNMEYLTGQLVKNNIQVNTFSFECFKSEV